MTPRPLWSFLRSDIAQVCTTAGLWEAPLRAPGLPGLQPPLPSCEFSCYKHKHSEQVVFPLFVSTKPLWRTSALKPGRLLPFPFFIPCLCTLPGPKAPVLHLDGKIQRLRELGSSLNFSKSKISLSLPATALHATSVGPGCQWHCVLFLSNV